MASKRHTMHFGLAAPDFSDFSGGEAASGGDKRISVTVSFPLIKYSKSVEIDGARSIGDLRAAFLAGVDKKLLQRAKNVEQLVLLSSTGFWCQPGRTVQSYWFARDDQLQLCKKKRGKEYRVKFDGSVHVVEMHPDKSTVRGLIQALPKIDIRSYADYQLVLETERRHLNISDWSINLSVLGSRPTDVFIFASPDDLPGKRPADQNRPAPPRPLSQMASTPSLPSTAAPPPPLLPLPSKTSPSLPVTAPPTVPPPSLPTTAPPTLAPPTIAPPTVPPPSTAPPTVPPPSLPVDTAPPTIAPPSLPVDTTPPSLPPPPALAPPSLPSPPALAPPSLPAPPALAPPSLPAPPALAPPSLPPPAALAPDAVPHSLPALAPAPPTLAPPSLPISRPTTPPGLPAVPPPPLRPTTPPALPVAPPPLRPATPPVAPPPGLSPPLPALPPPEQPSLPALSRPVSLIEVSRPKAAGKQSPRSPRTRPLSDMATVEQQQQQQQQPPPHFDAPSLASRRSTVVGPAPPPPPPPPLPPAVSTSGGVDGAKLAAPAAQLSSSRSAEDINVERQRAASVSLRRLGTEEEESIRNAIHSAIVGGKKTKKQAQKQFQQLTSVEDSGDAKKTAEPPRTLDQSKLSKAKTKLSRFLSQRHGEAALRRSDGGEAGSGGGKGALSAKRAGSSATISRSVGGGEQSAPISEECMLFFVEHLLRFDAVQTHGIFRVSGVVERSQAILREALPAQTPLDPEQFSVHDVSSAFKAYLRSAPEPLVPFDAFQPLLDTLDVADEQQRTLAIARQAARLPSAHLRSLFLLLRLCRAIAANADSNMMTPHNLGIVFGPTIMRERVESPSYLSSANQDFFEDLIDRFDSLLELLPDVDAALPGAEDLPLAWLDSDDNDDLTLPSDAPLLTVLTLPSDAPFLTVLPLPARVPVDDMRVRWLSSPDVEYVSVALVAADDAGAPASFVGYLAVRTPNTGALSVARLPFAADDVSGTRYLVVVEQLTGNDAEPLFDVSPPFNFFVQPPAAVDPLHLLGRLASATDRRAAAEQLAAIDDSQLLPLVGSHPDVVVAALRSLASALLCSQQS